MLESQLGEPFQLLPETHNTYQRKESGKRRSGATAEHAGVIRANREFPGARERIAVIDRVYQLLSFSLTSPELIASQFEDRCAYGTRESKRVLSTVDCSHLKTSIEALGVREDLSHGMPPAT